MKIYIDTCPQAVRYAEMLSGRTPKGVKSTGYDWYIPEGSEIVGTVEGVSLFLKQLGGFPDKRDDPAAWPADVRVQQFPA